MYLSETMIDYSTWLPQPHTGPYLNLSRRHVQITADNVVQIMIEDEKTW